MRYFTLLLVLCSTSGCLFTAPYWVRRAVVHDDVVLVKDTNVLYRRYIPDGVRLRPNMELIKKVGQITAGNDKITVYGSYAEAKASGIPFTDHFSVKEDAEAFNNPRLHTSAVDKE